MYCVCKGCGAQRNVAAVGYCAPCMATLDAVAVGRSLAESGAPYTTSEYVQSRIPDWMNHKDIAKALGWTYRRGERRDQWDRGRVRQRFFTGLSVRTSLLVELLLALGEDTRDIGPLRETIKYHCHCGEGMVQPALECGFCAEECLTHA